MRFLFWLSLKLLKKEKRYNLTASTWISIVGLAIGVASLVVSMSVMSGFESTLAKSVSDVVGHVQVIGRVDLSGNKEIIHEIQEITPDLMAWSPFLFLEGVLAHQGQLRGVFIQGMDSQKINGVLDLPGRILNGDHNYPQSQDSQNQAWVGKGLAKDFNLKVGDEFSIVVPIANALNPSQFGRSLSKFTVTGILDLGRYEYDQRMLFTDLKSSQTLAKIDDKISGYILRYPNYKDARSRATVLAQKFSPALRTRDWRDVNQNLFEAVRIERIVIFFVVLVIVVAAAFTTASSLYIHVIRKFSEISTLKSMGLTSRQVSVMFSMQGFILGAVGLTLGLILGLGLVYIFEWAQVQFELIPGSIYNLDRIILDVRWIDLMAISIVTLIICFIATLAPARKGAKLKPVEGLRL